MTACVECRWLDADYEDASDGGWMTRPYVVCRSRDKVSNLRQFPFKKTNCSAYEPQPNEDTA